MSIVPLMSDFDPTAISPLNHHTETRTFVDGMDRIFIPEYGPFYTQGLSIVNTANNQPLVRGLNVEFLHLHREVTKITGKEVCTCINVTDSSITSIRLIYQFPGGIYQSVTPVLKDLMDKYPNGFSPVFDWNSIMYKPDQFKPSAHLHHMNEFYGLAPMVSHLESIREAISHRDNDRYQALFTLADSQFNTILTKIAQVEQSLTAAIELLRSQTEVGMGEYIFTDNAANPATYKGYGNWRRITSTFLMGGISGQAGQGIVLQKGVDIPVRLCYIWQRIDNWIEQTFDIVSDKQAISEGDDVTFTLSTTNVAANTQIPFDLVGVEAYDVKNGTLSGMLQVGANGTASVTITTLKDLATDGDKTMRLQLRFYPTVGADVLVMDTSIRPVYNVFFSADANGLNPINQTTEGSNVYLNVITQGVAAGDIINLNWAAGTVTDNDMDAPLPKSLVNPSSGTLRIKLAIKNDQLTENTEFMVVNVMPPNVNDLGQAFARAELVVLDTSVKPVYNLMIARSTTATTAITSVNEGETVYGIIRTADVPNGTKVKLVWGGTADSNDVTGMVSEAMIMDSLYTFPITINADRNTEGTEVLGLELYSLDGLTRYASTSVMIVDTSKTPAYNLYISDKSAGGGLIDQIDEGQSFYIVAETVNLANDYLLNLSYSIVGKNDSQATIAADFSTALPSTLRISNNRAYALLTTKKDFTLEGDETLCITISDGTVKIKDLYVTIKDTSVPTCDLSFSSNAAGTSLITQADEGTSFYLQIATQGLADNTVLALSYSGTAVAGDFSSTRPTTATIVANKASVKFDSLVDYSSEGNETMTVVVNHANIPTTQATITIVDKSLTPSISPLASLSTTNKVQITSVNEFETLILHATMSNMPAGQVVNWSIVPVNGASTSDFGTMTGSFTTTANQTSWVGGNVLVVNDELTESTETFKVRMSTTLPNGVVIAGETPAITIIDASKTPTYDIFYSSSATGSPVITSTDEVPASPIYLIVKTTELPDGTSFTMDLDPAYVGAGCATLLDITSTTPANKTFTTTNGIAALAITIKDDKLTEGVENLYSRVSRNGKIIGTKSIRINDSSIAFAPVVTYVNESDQTITSSVEPANVYLKLDYTGAQVGDVVTVELVTGAGLLSADDIASSNIGSQAALVAGSSSLKWGVSVKPDRLTEGAETLRLRLVNLTRNQTIGTYDLSISDTSKTPTYTGGWYSSLTATSVATTLNEGTTAYLRIKPTDGVAGDVYRAEVVSTNMMPEDIRGSFPDLTWNSGEVVWWLDLVADRLSEGTENISAKVTNLTTGQVVGVFALNVGDTSLTTTYSGNWYSAASGGSIITSINELKTAYLRVTPTNGVVGDVYSASLIADTADVGDLVAMPPNVTFTGDPVVFPFSIIEDWPIEGDQVLTVMVRNLTTGQTAGTLGIVVKDVAYTARWSSNSSGSDTITSINEGSTAYLIIEGINADNGTLTLGYVGSTNNNDFATALPSSVTFSSNRAVATYTLKADLTFEGSENVRVDVSSGGRLVCSSPALVINDTSVSSFELKFCNNNTGSGEITTLNEGATAYLCLNTVGIADGTQYNVSWGAGSTTNADWVNGALASTITITGGKGYITVPALNDLLKEGDETLVAILNANNQTYSKTLTVKDTSVPYASIFQIGNNAGSNTLFEGQPAGIRVQYYGAVTPARVYLNYSGAATNADFAQTLPAYVDVTNGSFVDFPITPIVDSINDNDETLTITANLGSASGDFLGTSTFTIKDAIVNVGWYSDPAGNNPVTSANEGTSVYLVVKTTNVLDGEKVQVTWDGSTTDANDFITPPAGTVDITINNNIGYYKLDIKNDETTEG